MTRIRKTTIEDVAALAHVSIKTVSRVVNDEPNVRDETKEKVVLAIEQLNYRPNLSARRFAKQRSYIVALLYDNPSANYLFDVQSGVLSACRGLGYDLLVHPCDHSSSGLPEEIMSLYEQGRCDGIVLTPPLTDIDGVTETLRREAAPFVQISPAKRRSDYSWVATNDKQAGYEITRHLIDLGHRNIGFVQGHPDHKAMTTREFGYREALKIAGIPIIEDLIIAGYNNFESGQTAAEKLLDQAHPPSAIFAGNDDMAAGVIKAARKRGLEIPRDLSVVGFDDTAVASQAWPPLTTMRQPITTMAETATAALIGQLEGGHDSQGKRVIDADLVIRSSTGCASKTGA